MRARTCRPAGPPPARGLRTCTRGIRTTVARVPRRAARNLPAACRVRNTADGAYKESMDANSHDLTPELETVARRLRDARPQASGLELDRMKQRAMSQASAGSSAAWIPKKGLFMKP